MNIVQEKQSITSSKTDTDIKESQDQKEKLGDTSINMKYAEFSYFVNHQDNGMRLDHFLTMQASMQRKHVKDAIESKLVKISGRDSIVKASRILKWGETVVVTIYPRVEPDVSFDYKIIYEDDVMLAVNKSGNLPVHPAGRFMFNTLLAHMETEGFTKPWKGTEKFYLAHRIDRETSGVLLLAKSSEIGGELMKQFRDQHPQKEYLAVVRGAPKENKFSVNVPLRKDIEGELKLKMTWINGDLPSLTHFEVLETKGEFSLIRCMPVTGRQHQIRVHLAYVGLHILGDKVYLEDPSDDLLIKRQALHAEKITFFHPTSKKRMTISTPPHDDMKFDFSTLK